MTDVLLCVGNTMMGDDGAGPLLAQLCAYAPRDGWTVLDGGTIPENEIGHIRALQPARLVIVDATEMGLKAGAIRTIDENDISDMFFVTTHYLPLNILIDQLKPDVPDIVFIGIQPDVVSFCYPVSASVQQAVKAVHERLSDWPAGSPYPVWANVEE